MMFGIVCFRISQRDEPYISMRHMQLRLEGTRSSQHHVSQNKSYGKNKLALTFFLVHRYSLDVCLAAAFLRRYLSISSS